MSIVPKAYAEVELADRALPDEEVHRKPALAEHQEFSVFNVRSNKKIYNHLVQCHERDAQYITVLEALLKENGIDLPAKLEPAHERPRKYSTVELPFLPDAEYETLKESFAKIAKLSHIDEYEVQYRGLSFWGMVPKTHIPTVGSVIREIFFGAGPKHRTDILHDLTGRIRPRKMTLIMGPPGCGKSSLLKALAGQLNVGSKTLDGDLLYNGARPDEGKFILPKLTDYADERDQHAATLTVRETLEFAWRVTSNSRHSYAFAKDTEAANIMDLDNDKLTKVRSIKCKFKPFY